MTSDERPTAEVLQARREASDKSLNRVQRRVAAIGFFVTAEHAVLGLIGVAYVRENDGRHGDAIGLTVMSCVVAILVYLVIRLILGAKLWSPAWIALALVPSTTALIWLLR